MEDEKVISIEKHIPKLKEERKKKTNRRFVFYLIIFLILLFIIVYLQSPLSKIKTIKITGNTFLSAEEILDFNYVSIGQSMWLIDQSKVEKKLEQSPYINNAKVSRTFPRTVNINIKEQDVIGYIQDDKNQFIPVLKNGEVQNKDALKQPTNRLIFHDFSEEDYLNRLVEELKEVPDSILNLISEITWKPTEKNKYQIELYMNDGYTVIATIRDFKSKIVLYPSVVEQLDEDDKGVIHLGAGTYFEKEKKNKKNKKK